MFSRINLSETTEKDHIVFCFFFMSMYFQLKQFVSHLGTRSYCMCVTFYRGFIIKKVGLPGGVEWGLGLGLLAF